MPTNKGALIRRQVLDRCLSSRSRSYSVLELMEECNKVLVEHGFKTVSSENTIRTDMDEIQYQYAPQAEIRQLRKGRNIYYHYSDRDFSIYKIPLSDNEILGLAQALSVLSRFDGMPGFEWLDGLVNRFKPQLNIDLSVAHVVGFDENLDLKGREYFAPLLEATVGQQVILIRYCGYRSHQEFSAIVHPYYLKQYNNRWFLLGWNEEREILSTFAFDRILEITTIPKKFKPNTSIDFFEFFDDMIGVSRSIEDTPEEVRLFISNKQLPYILSKPLHGTQRVIEYLDDGAVISIKVILNFELEQTILGLGKSVKVLSPNVLVDRIRQNISETNKFYQ